MNGWFPKIRTDAVVASGNAGIWLTGGVGSRQFSPVGIGPVWMGNALVFNQNNGTTYVGGLSIPVAYNDYRGSDDDRWAGFVAVGEGETVFYRGLVADVPVPKACAPRFGGATYGYLTPFQPAADGLRTLVLDGALKAASGVLLDWAIEPSGAFYVYQVGTSTYGRQIKDEHGAVVSINDNEAPIALFLGPDGQRWMVSGTTNDGLFVRPVYSDEGYRLVGERFYPDARVYGANLMVASSSSSGVLQVEWVNLYGTRHNLRHPAGDSQ